jgi:predicted metal-dependent phosphoesterase TrpH
MSPRDLVARARSQNVDVLALTDHDTLDGLAEARAAAVEYGLSLLNGVEISADWNGRSLHVVGLGIDPGNGTLRHGLTQVQAIRQQRAEEMARRLEAAGFRNALEGARRYGDGRNVTRTHFARYLVAQGAAASVSDVFRNYLRAGKTGYVKTTWAPLREAVAWINGAGGRAVIAHPSRYNFSGCMMRALLADFVDCGGAGLEVVYSGCDPNTIRDNAAYARRFKLRASLGSDFHDPNVPWAELGRLPPLPADLIPIWTDVALPS